MEAYTGAKITWIDSPRRTTTRDCNERSPRAPSTSTLSRWEHRSEGDVCGKGLASEMPDWVKQVIDMDDYVGYLKPPVGTWNSKAYRISIDGDCLQLPHRRLR